SAASRHDARRGSVGFEETVETPACSPNDAQAAPIAGRRAQFFAGPERDAADFPAAVCESGSCRRGEWCVAANSAAACETLNASKRLARLLVSVPLFALRKVAWDGTGSGYSSPATEE